MLWKLDAEADIREGHVLVTDGFDKKGSGKMKPPFSGNPLGIVDIHRGCGLPRVSLGSGREPAEGWKMRQGHQTHLLIVGLNASCRHFSVIMGSSLSSKLPVDEEKAQT